MSVQRPSPGRGRFTTAGPVLILVLLALMLAVVTPSADARTAGAGPDFNGDGFEDVVLGTPLEGIGANTEVGAITVLYGNATGVSGAGSQLLHQGTAGLPGANETGDNWGSAVEYGDFDGDGFDDIAVAAENEDVGTLTDAGAVTILYGSANGVTTSGAQLLHQASAGVPGANEAGDRWGAALAVGDFDSDGVDDLAISATAEDIGASSDTGAVTILFGSQPDGLHKGDAGQLFHQNSPGVPGGNETQDFWGLRLAAADFNGDGNDDLAIGAPFESVGSVSLAGAVTILFSTGTGLASTGAQLMHQDTAGVPGAPNAVDFWGETLTAGDFDGDGFADLAIGEPRQGLTTSAGGNFAVSTGAVTVLYGSGSGIAVAGSQYLHQALPTIPGDNAVEDRFGEDLQVGDFNGDDVDDLAIGIRGKDSNGVGDSGAVVVVFGHQDGLLGAGVSQSINQGTPGIAGNDEIGDRWGVVLKRADLNNDGVDDLLVGAPNEGVGAAVQVGAVTSILGVTGSGLTGTSVVLHQNSAGIPGANESEDQWGLA